MWESGRKGGGERRQRILVTQFKVHILLNYPDNHSHPIMPLSLIPSYFILSPGGPVRV